MSFIAPKSTCIRFLEQNNATSVSDLLLERRVILEIQHQEMPYTRPYTPERGAE